MHGRDFLTFFLQCPHHGFEEQFRIETFYDGLLQDDKIIIDSICQGKLMNMTTPQLTEMLEDVATTGYDWGLTKSGRRDTKRGVHLVEASPPLAAKIDGLIDALLEDKKQGKKLLMACDWCSSTNNEISKCQLMKEASTTEEQVSLMANARNNNP
ncbi:unnamed protein product [Linum trigynum]|uniref:Uncharacterized protein n=1 Tax=Linum trigynum TaxID=586398 RepID=A0AAV2F8G6_9ROSI